jgi:hypothetical protein
MLNNSKWFDRDIFKQGIDASKAQGLVNLKNPIKLEKVKGNKAPVEEEKKKGAKEPTEDDQDQDDFFYEGQ